MIRTIVYRLKDLPVLAHGTLAVAVFGGFQLVKSALDTAYLASRYPVDYATGQLAFDHIHLENYYKAMINAGTLGLYWKTQFIDFGFIAMVAAMGVTFGALASRMGPPDSWVSKLGLACAYAAFAGAAFDVLENLLSFVMLARPLAIPASLAVLYSLSAALKFFFMTSAMALMLSGSFAGLAHWLRQNLTMA